MKDSMFQQPLSAETGTCTARQLTQGLILVPCWGRDKNGQRIPCCTWVRPHPGETLSDAAHRLARRMQSA